MAVQKAGVGYSVYLGSDDFNNWRRYPSEGLHERFWAGIVRFLALGRRQGGSRELTLDTDRDR